MTKSAIGTMPDAMMLSVQDVAKIIQCSDRHVSNLRKAGRIPPPVKLGELVRWPRRVIDEWIQAGCPAAAAPGFADNS